MTEPRSDASEEEAAARWVSEARERWPHITFAAADFRRHLDALGRAVPVFPGDTYLAAACAAGDGAAIRVLDDELVARVPAMVRRVDGSPAFAEDICQQLRIRVLVREGDAIPRIARYTGDVPLSAWMRVIALRLALNAKRGVRSRGERKRARATRRRSTIRSTSTCERSIESRSVRRSRRRSASCRRTTGPSCGCTTSTV